MPAHFIINNTDIDIQYQQYQGYFGDNGHIETDDKEKPNFLASGAIPPGRQHPIHFLSSVSFSSHAFRHVTEELRVFV